MPRRVVDPFGPSSLFVLGNSAQMFNSNSAAGQNGASPSTDFPTVHRASAATFSSAPAVPKIGKLIHMRTTAGTPEIAEQLQNKGIRINSFNWNWARSSARAKQLGLRGCPVKTPQAMENNRETRAMGNFRESRS